MRRLKDRTGERHNRLTVVALSHFQGEGRHRKAMWECKCDCGNQVIVLGESLRTGNTKSCGCLNRELAREKLVRANTKHGDSGIRVYNIWRGMRDRCSESALIHERGRSYAQAGVSVCDEWKEYKNFKQWALDNGYGDELTLDRIDPFGNYEPKNCRWVSMSVQYRNKRDTLYVVFSGKKVTMKEAAATAGVDYHLAWARIQRLGWSVERALQRDCPYRHGGKVC